MDSNSWLLYVLLVALIIGGGYFAGAEIAFASCNKIRLKTQAEAGDSRSKTALFISEHFDNALTTLLIGNNIMHIGCSSLATLLATHLWGPSSVGPTTLVITLVVFFISEMLPKSFCRSHADMMVLFFAGSLRFLMRVLKPIAWFFSSISTICAKLFGSKPCPSFTEAELETMMETAQASPALHQENEDRLLTSAMAFDHITARQAMQPVEKMEALEIMTSAKDIAAFAQNHTHSRIPIYRGSIDNIVGVIHIREYLRTYLRNGSKTRLRAMMNPPAFVQPDTPIDEVLAQMSSHRVQLAIVRAQQHKTLGVLTVEDILEELVGEIQDEEDTEGTVKQRGYYPSLYWHYYLHLLFGFLLRFGDCICFSKYSASEDGC